MAWTAAKIPDQSGAVAVVTGANHLWWQRIHTSPSAADSSSLATCEPW
jgi:hypothetical protein